MFQIVRERFVPDERDDMSALVALIGPRARSDAGCTHIDAVDARLRHG